MTTNQPAFSVTVVDHTGITVSDIDRSITFWIEVMGFELVRRGHLSGEFAAQVTGVPGADINTAIVRTPGHTIELLQYVSPKISSAETLRSPAAPGASHIALQVDNIDAVAAHLCADGWFTRGAIQTMAEGPRTGDRKSVV